MALPNVEPGAANDTAAFRIKGKLFAWLDLSGESVVVKFSDADRRARMLADPHTFHLTDHYRKSPVMLVRLSSVSDDELSELVVESWHRCAPRGMVAAYDRGT